MRKAGVLTVTLLSLGVQAVGFATVTWLFFVAGSVLLGG